MAPDRRAAGRAAGAVDRPGRRPPAGPRRAHRRRRGPLTLRLKSGVDLGEPRLNGRPIALPTKAGEWTSLSYHAPTPTASPSASPPAPAGKVEVAVIEIRDGWPRGVSADPRQAAGPDGHGGYSDKTLVLDRGALAWPAFVEGGRRRRRTPARHGAPRRPPSPQRGEQDTALTSLVKRGAGARRAVGRMGSPGLRSRSPPSARLRRIKSLDHLRRPPLQGRALVQQPLVGDLAGVDGRRFGQDGHAGHAARAAAGRGVERPDPLAQDRGQLVQRRARPSVGDQRRPGRPARARPWRR